MSYNDPDHDPCIFAFFLRSAVLGLILWVVLGCLISKAASFIF